MSGVVLAAALAVTACGGKTQGTEEAQKAPAESAKPVKLQVLTPGGGNNEWFMDRYGKSIQQKYPHISFEVIENTGQTVQNLVTEKRKIDLIITSFVGYRGQIKPVELTADMSDLIKKHQFDINRLDPAYMDMIRNLDGGKVTALPLYDLSLLLYYNKDIFDKFGVPYPTDNMTWESLYSVATRLTRNEGGVQYRGFVTAPSNLVSVNQLSLGYLDSKGEKAALQTDPWKQFIETMLPLYTMPGYNATKAMISGNAIKEAFFKEKSSAMFVMFNSDAPKPEDGLNWNAVSLPEMKQAPGVGSQPYPVYIAVASTSEHRDEAFLSIAHLLSDEVQTKLMSDFAQISPLKSTEVKAAFGRNVAQWQGKNIAAIRAKKPAAPPAYVGEYNNFGQTAITNAMLSVIVGEKDMNTALRDADEEVNKKIAEAKAMKK
ncbi:carbohydrate ABC transporter substrate-binding protein [Paenibacillus mesophilus]|uniref:ABC transporter substrate-binding protein n=1 Tax=Paenibacillus mesophilus TaxID=2582849 RepID=UPI00110DE0BB|nr:ABC transporter substrate-binding protein [Paenibacillus mesophilus]TMV43843.1 carbohydrate ABC transporter substrate-binding protein [Paenibacillus mesophilus]